jgi:copper chaperone NosL
MLRRTLFLFSTAILLAGCKDGKESAAALKPQEIGRHDRCHLCGMVILNYEGPKAQVYLKNVAEPVKFCSTRDAFTFALQPENQRRLQAFFVTDLSRTAWDKPTAESFMDAKSAYFVLGSRREGAMGSEAVPFSVQKDAEGFQKREGGKILRYGDITLNALNS